MWGCVRATRSLSINQSTSKKKKDQNGKTVRGQNARPNETKTKLKR